MYMYIQLYSIIHAYTLYIHEQYRYVHVYLNERWYDRVNGLSDDLEAVLVIISQEIGAHECKHRHNIVQHLTLRGGEGGGGGEGEGEGEEGTGRERRKGRERERKREREEEGEGGKERRLKCTMCAVSGKCIHTQGRVMQPRRGGGGRDGG